MLNIVSVSTRNTTRFDFLKPKSKKNMKKILIITLFAFGGNIALAQGQTKEIRNVRFGLIVNPSLNWYKPDGKIMSGNGVVPKIGGGLSIEFRLASVASIVTGVQIDMDGGKIKYANGGPELNSTNTVSYYYSSTSDEIAGYLSRPENNPADAHSYDQTHNKYMLNERQFKSTYVTIPFCIKLKTKEIGMMTYFGQVGINNSFRWKAKANDKVIELPTSATLGGASDTKSNLNITKEMNFYAASLYLGAGCEMNLSGSTSLLLGLHYNLGFTSVTAKESPTLEKKTNGPNYVSSSGADYTTNAMPQTLKSNGVVLTVGILF